MGKWVFESPPWVRDLIVTLEGTRLYLLRRGRLHRKRKEEYRRLLSLPYEEMRKYQDRQFAELFHTVKARSPYYALKYRDIQEPVLQRLPILEKSDLLQHVDRIIIGDKQRMIKAYTGGTTGTSLAVYLSRASLQARIAFLDLFWEMHGYTFRDKFAWFSGRKLLSEKDRKRNRFWFTNSLLNIRYYSTFDMGWENLEHYVNNLNHFSPNFISGFPSAISEIARFISARGMKPGFDLKGIFTSSETLLPSQRSIMESIFRCRVFDQYGAAEGPPFIIQCPCGHLHLDMSTGIMEVVDDDLQSAREGEILVTSFHMKETPIIRYRIGDRVRMSGEIGCPCGWETPIVEAILGRKADYIDVPGRGKVWCAQIGDCVKGVSTVVRFQVGLVEDRLLDVRVVCDPEEFEKKDRQTFLANLRDRVGDFPVRIVYCQDIPPSRSGKHSVIQGSSR
ncbi:MAG: hypothetical protein AB1512_06700 [Thermodesulfobacteriota bacterium]